MNSGRTGNYSCRQWGIIIVVDGSQASTFSAVDGYVRRRLRSLLQWRLDGVGKGIGAAHQRWPNRWFARRGLLSVAAEHEWTRTIVNLRTH